MWIIKGYINGIYRTETGYISTQGKAQPKMYMAFCYAAAEEGAQRVKENIHTFTDQRQKRVS